MANNTKEISRLHSEEADEEYEMDVNMNDNDSDSSQEVRSPSYIKGELDDRSREACHQESAENKSSESGPDERGIKSRRKSSPDKMDKNRKRKLSPDERDKSRRKLSPDERDRNRRKSSPDERNRRKSSPDERDRKRKCPDEKDRGRKRRKEAEARNRKRSTDKRDRYQFDDRYEDEESEEDNDRSDYWGSEDYSESESDYEAYDPRSSFQAGQWSLPEKMAKYAEDKFLRYIPEEAMKETIKETPRPKHKFLQASKLDYNLDKSSLAKAVGPKRSKFLLRQDQTLESSQEKILRIMGPLSKLWTHFNEVRKNEEEGKISVTKGLRLIEQAVLLTGQANVAVKYARRKELMAALVPSEESPKSILMKHDEALTDPSFLFGDKFQKRMEKEYGKEKGGLLALKKNDSKPYHRRPTGERTPFRRGPLRGGQRGGRGRSRGSNRNERYVQILHQSNQNFIEQPTQQSCETKSDETKYISITIDHPNNKITTAKQSSTSSPDQDRGKDQPLSKQLASSNKRPGNNSNGKRLRAKINGRCAPPPAQEFHPQVQQKGIRKNKTGNSRIVKQRSNNRNTSQTSSISRSSVFETEERRRNETCFQPQKPKQANRVSTLQNGGMANAQDNNQTGRLDGQIRPEGRLLLRSDAEAGSQIPVLPVGRQSIPVQLSPIRASFRSEIIHQTAQTSNSNNEKTRLSDDSISRRLPANESKPYRTNSTSKLPHILVAEPGLHHQPEKIRDQPLPDNKFPRSEVEQQRDDNKPSSRQAHRDSTELCPNAGQPSLHRTRSRKPLRQNECHGLSNNSSHTLLQKPANAQNNVLEETEILRGSDQSEPRMQNGTEVVERKSGTMERQSNHSPRTRHDNRDRCEQYGMGCINEQQRNQRKLDERRIPLAQQCTRIESHRDGSKSNDKGENKNTRSHKIGQYCSNCKCQQNGDHEIQTTASNSSIPMGLLSPKEHNSISRTSPRPAKCNSGFPVKRKGGIEQLEAEREHLQNDQQEMGRDRDRFICGSDKSPSKKICELETRSICNCRGCHTDKLEQMEEPLCISPILHDRPMSQESGEGGNRHDPHNTSMAESSLVPIITDDGNRTPDFAAQPGKSSDQPQRHVPPDDSNESLEISGMENIRRELEAEGISEEAATLVLKGWRPGTRVAYDSAWKKWHCWCQSREVDSLSSNPATIIEFLKDMHENQLEYSTINGYRSALSNILPKINGTPIGQHELVKRTMVAIFNEKPSQPKCSGTWDVDVVLDLFKRWGANETLTDKHLTWKVTTLIALTSASRASEIRALDLEHMVDTGLDIEFTIPGLTKTRRPGDKPVKVSMKSYDECKVLDVRRCILDYIKRTAAWRVDADKHKLLLSTIKPHNPVATSTISGWIKSTLTEAGIDTSIFTAHSTRAASTSKAVSSGVSVIEIMQKANWKRASTFKIFYRKDITKTESFQDAVMKVLKHYTLN